MTNLKYLTVKQAAAKYAKNKNTVQEYARNWADRKTEDGQPVSYQDGTRKRAPWMILESELDTQFGPGVDERPPADFIQAKAMDALIGQLESSTDQIRALNAQLVVKDQQLAAKDQQIYGNQVVIGKLTGVDLKQIQGQKQEIRITAPKPTFWQKLRGAV